MIYVGYQVTPVPGKLNDVLAVHKQAKEISEACGAQQIGGFQITLGQDARSLFYLVAYRDSDAFIAVTKALEDSAAMKQADAWIASSSSAVLQPLPGSALQ